MVRDVTLGEVIAFLEKQEVLEHAEFKRCLERKDVDAILDYSRHWQAVQTALDVISYAKNHLLNKDQPAWWL